MPDSKPRLLILGTPPSDWLHNLGTIRDLAEVETAATEQEAGERLAEAEIAFTWERAGAWVRRQGNSGVYASEAGWCLPGPAPRTGDHSISNER